MSNQNGDYFSLEITGKRWVIDGAAGVLVPDTGHILVYGRSCAVLTPNCTPYRLCRASSSTWTWFGRCMTGCDTLATCRSRRYLSDIWRVRISWVVDIVHTIATHVSFNSGNRLLYCHEILQNLKSWSLQNLKPWRIFKQSEDFFNTSQEFLKNLKKVLKNSQGRKPTAP